MEQAVHGPLLALKALLEIAYKCKKVAHGHEPVAAGPVDAVPVVMVKPNSVMVGGARALLAAGKAGKRK